jgi:hypothetical protein
MAFKRLLYEGKRGVFVAGRCDEALQDFALLVDRTPQLGHLPVQLCISSK